MKKFISIMLVVIMAAAFSACGSSGSSTGSSKVVQTSSSNTSTVKFSNVPEKPEFTEVGSNGSRTDDPVGFQFDPPEAGEEIAVFHTSEGDVRIRLFPDSAPIAVANFKALIENDYYNGITFHRVINNFMIQGGDPTATGKGGQSIWGKSFEYETNANLRHYIGALSMAHSNLPDSNGSQFFIVQGKQVTESDLQSSGLSDTEKELYYEHGGYFSLDGQYSVFGQVFDGMDVVNKIAAVEVDANDKPLTDVVIESAEIVKYEEE